VDEFLFFILFFILISTFLRLLEMEDSIPKIKKVISDSIYLKSSVQ